MSASDSEDSAAEATFDPIIAKNRFGAIFYCWGLGNRSECTTIWAQPPSSKSYEKTPFECSLKLDLPSEDERLGGRDDQEYLWIGVLPGDYQEWSSGKLVRDVRKGLENEEKVRRKEKNEEWNRLPRKEKKGMDKNLFLDDC